MKDSDKILNARYVLYDNLNSNETDTVNIKFPFSKFVFNDVRFDTSFIAINWQSSFVSRETLNKKYNFNHGLAYSISRYFNQYYTKSFSTVDNKFVCYIKKFSVTLRDDDLKYFNAGDEVNNKKENNVNLEIECYYKTGDTLYPAIRVDTTYTFSSMRFKKDFTDAVTEMIRPLIEKTDHLNFDNVVKRKAYTADQVVKRYAGRFDLPILTVQAGKKGIYKTFAEFKIMRLLLIHSPSLQKRLNLMQRMCKKLI